MASVFRYAVVTTKERSFIASSINPVATIWLSAPSSSHGQNAAVGHGQASPERSGDGEGNPERGEGEHVRGNRLGGNNCGYRAGRGQSGQPKLLHATSTAWSSLQR